MNARDEDQFLTIKTLASWVTLDPSDEGITRTLRQLRHWTQNDLLCTEGRKDTGKGIPRLYAEDPTFQIAAILVELSRYVSALDALKAAAEALYTEWNDDGAVYFNTALTDMDAYIQVSWETDPKKLVILNARVQMFDMMDEAENRLDDQPSSSILINMTNVADRTYQNRRAYEKAKEGNDEFDDGS